MVRECTDTVKNPTRPGLLLWWESALIQSETQHDQVSCYGERVHWYSQKPNTTRSPVMVRECTDTVKNTTRPGLLLWWENALIQSNTQKYQVSCYGERMHWYSQTHKNTRSPVMVRKCTDTVKHTKIPGLLLETENTVIQPVNQLSEWWSPQNYADQPEVL